LFDEGFQCPGLAYVAREIKQIAEPPHGRVLVGAGGLRELARVGLAADVFGDLRDAIDAARLVKVAGAVQQR
jgi:hypothetical protein